MYAASRTPLGLIAGSTLFDVVSHRQATWLLRVAAVMAAPAAGKVLYLLRGVADRPACAAAPVPAPGLGRLRGPTGGCLLAYPAAAFVTGLLAERRFDRRYATSLVAMLTGLAIVYV
ncbi:MAG: biotin transporter BioY, partial [Luteitalea sp.]